MPRKNLEPLRWWGGVAVGTHVGRRDKRLLMAPTSKTISQTAVVDGEGSVCMHISSSYLTPSSIKPVAPLLWYEREELSFGQHAPRPIGLGVQYVHLTEREAVIHQRP
jgi:hypothetical protein